MGRVVMEKIVVFGEITKDRDNELTILLDYEDDGSGYGVYTMDFNDTSQRTSFGDGALALQMAVHFHTALVNLAVVSKVRASDYEEMVVNMNKEYNDEWVMIQNSSSAEDQSNFMFGLIDVYGFLQKWLKLSEEVRKEINVS